MLIRKKKKHVRVDPFVRVWMIDCCMRLASECRTQSICKHHQHPCVLFPRRQLNKVHVYQVDDYGDEVNTTWMHTTRKLKKHASLLDELGVDELEDLHLVDAEDLMELNIDEQRAHKLVARFHRLASSKKILKKISRKISQKESKILPHPNKCGGLQWIIKYELVEYAHILDDIGVERFTDLYFIDMDDLKAANVDPQLAQKLLRKFDHIKHLAAENRITVDDSDDVGSTLGPREPLVPREWMREHHLTEHVHLFDKLGVTEFHHLHQRIHMEDLLDTGMDRGAAEELLAEFRQISLSHPHTAI